MRLLQRMRARQDSASPVFLIAPSSEMRKTRFLIHCCCRRWAVTESKPLYTSADKERIAPEPPKPGAQEPYRTVWRVDFARLVHSPAFRRLQGKIQLFPGELDFFRNRLTHSLEVAQIAKSIAISLRMNTSGMRRMTTTEFQRT